MNQQPLSKLDMLFEFFEGTLSLYGVVIAWIGIAVQETSVVLIGAAFIAANSIAGIIGRVRRGLDAEQIFGPVAIPVIIFVVVVAVIVVQDFASAKTQWSSFVALVKFDGRVTMKNIDVIWGFIRAGLMGVLYSYTVWDLLSVTGNVLATLEDEQSRRIAAMRAENSAGANP